MFKFKTPLEILQEIRQRKLDREKKSQDTVKQVVKEVNNEQQVNKKKSKRKRAVQQ